MMTIASTSRCTCLRLPAHAQSLASASSSRTLSTRTTATATTAAAVSLASLAARRPASLLSLAPPGTSFTSVALRAVHHSASNVERGLPDAPSQWKPTRPAEQWTMNHKVYKTHELDAVKIVQHERPKLSDKLAGALVSLARQTFDFVTRYKHADPEAGLAQARKDGVTDLSLASLRDKGYAMTPKQWQSRVLLLESIAGVPGMVAATLRHLRSLRKLQRDGGWLHVLLQEAENERMHLMTFLKIAQPGLFMRFMIIAAQGVFYNLFFLAYLVHPAAAHRFVGCLEEEACVTYTHILHEMEQGRLPEWNDIAVPNIAKDYWHMADDANMHDLIAAIRADEAGHRFVNHTLANLKASDVNPFAYKHASAELEGSQPGFSREQSLEWTESAKKDVERLHQQQVGAGSEQPTPTKPST